MPDSGQRIGDWDQSTLIKFIQDALRDQQNSALTFLSVDDLLVRGSLQVNDKLVMTRDTKLHYVGTTGEPAFANSWVNFGSSFLSAAYWKDALGNILLQGLIKSGTVGNAAFTLPPGYRPPATADFGTISNGAIGLVSVLSNGQVIPATPSNNTYVSLNGIFFRPA